MSRHETLRSTLGDFIDGLQIILGRKAEFIEFIKSEIWKQELILKKLAKKLADFQKCPLIPKSTELSGKPLELQKTLTNLGAKQKEVNRLILKINHDLKNLQISLTQQSLKITSLESNIERLVIARGELRELANSLTNLSLSLTTTKQD